MEESGTSPDPDRGGKRRTKSRVCVGANARTPDGEARTIGDLRCERRRQAQDKKREVPWLASSRESATDAREIK